MIPHNKRMRNSLCVTFLYTYNQCMPLICKMLANCSRIRTNDEDIIGVVKTVESYIYTITMISAQARSRSLSVIRRRRETAPLD